MSFRQEIKDRRCEFDNRDLVHVHAGRGEDGATGLRILLVGKDGGVKMDSSNQPGLTLQNMFDRIDTMPMRKREMRYDTKC